jgi:hypothetical protein
MLENENHTFHKRKCFFGTLEKENRYLGKKAPYCAVPWNDIP